MVMFGTLVGLDVNELVLLRVGTVILGIPVIVKRTFVELEVILKAVLRLSLARLNLGTVAVTMAVFCWRRCRSDPEVRKEIRKCLRIPAWPSQEQMQ